MDRVYIVTNGDYSDCMIVGVFTDEATAEHVRDLLNRTTYPSARIDEWPLSQTIYGRDALVYHVAVHSSGPQMGEVKRDNVRAMFETPTGSAAHRIFKTGRAGTENTCDVYRVEATSEEQAVKIAADAWARDRAERLGVGA